MYLVYDLETETRVHLRRKASPWHPDNYIVAAGWKKQGDSRCSWVYHDKPTKFNLHIPENVTLLVGFNLKFDMLWQWDNPELKAFFKRGGRIWDCQYVEYLLSGQDARFHYPALTEVSPRYGGKEKIDEVKVLWDAGVATKDINEDLLIDYLVGTEEEGRDGGDVGNTEKVFLGQLARVKQEGMLNAVMSRMDGLCATTEMEWNGLKVDVQEAKLQLSALMAEKDKLYTELQTYIPDTPDGFEFSWNSRVHKSCLLFGGTAKYVKQAPYIDAKTGEYACRRDTETHWVLDDKSTTPVVHLEEPPENVVRFLSGKNKGAAKTVKVEVRGELKTKYQDFYVEFPGYVKALPEWATKTTDARGKSLYSTSGDTIAALENTDVPFCKVLSRYEAVVKELGTYFVTRNSKGDLSGMLTCVDPSTHLIHPNFNHCSTVTARLSSDNPNMQNIPRGDKSAIKKLFVSRYANGTMLEADYSQLEIVVQGLLSGDKNLIQDLINRVDFHCKRVAIQDKYKITYDEVKAIIGDEAHPDHKFWKKIRTAAKIFSFQRSYGAGAALIALSTGLSVEDVKDLIAAEDAAYPGIVHFNEDVAMEVAGSAEPFRDPQNNFQVYRRGYWRAPTGCKYHFRSWPAQEWQKERGIEESFSPTEMKNYPVQGTGGEIVQGMCGRLWRHFVSNDNYGGKALLVNTVHDCVWVDHDSIVSEQVAADVKRIMESVPEWLKTFGIECPVPFPVEVEQGANMLELHHSC